MTKAEYIKRYGEEWYESYMEQHKLYCREYRKKPEVKEYQNEYSKEYKKERLVNEPEYRDNMNEYKKEYSRNDLNSKGTTKSSIRGQSRRILFEERKHTKLKDYQIHHAFGYEDPMKFIYIPKSLHVKIHQYLRDNSIDADSNHYDYIKHMINECSEYTYISV